MSGLAGNSVEVLERFIERLLGEEALKIFRTLANERRDMTEDEISEKVGFGKNITRKTLYSLSEYRLVLYKRVKDRDTGWYYYYWRLNYEELPFVLLELKKDIVSKLREKAARLREESSVYVCPACNRKYSFNQAFEREFRCEYCNVELVYVDASSLVKKLDEIIHKLEEELADEQKSIQSS